MSISLRAAAADGMDTKNSDVSYQIITVSNARVGIRNEFTEHSIRGAEIVRAWAVCYNEPNECERVCSTTSLAAVQLTLFVISLAQGL